MAEKNYELEFGGQIVKVPAWATNEQMENLINLDNNNLKKLQEISASNLGTFKAVNELVKRFERTESDATKKNDELIKALEKEMGNVEAAIKGLKRSQDQDDRDEEKQRKKRQEAEKQMIADMKDGIDNIRKSAKDAVSALSKGDFEGLATAIGSVVGFGAALGFVAKTLEIFGKTVGELANVGTGFGMSLQEIRSYAADLGTDLDGLAKLAQTGSYSLKALGDSTTEGMSRFAGISRAARGVERGLTQFGFTNQQVNELLLEDIELRIKSGQNSEIAANRAAESFRALGSETSKLAAITGVNRREAMRAGLDAAAEDPRLRRFRSEFESEYSVMMGALSNTQEGIDISKALVSAIADPGKDFEMVLGSMNSELLDMLNRIPGAVDAFKNIEQFGEQNVGNMDIDEYTSQYVTRLANVMNGLTSGHEETLLDASDLGDAQARAALNFADEFNQLNRDLEANITRLRDAGRTVGRDSERGTLDLPSSIESFSNQLKSSTMDLVMEGLNLNSEEMGDNVTQAFDGLTEQLRTEGLLSTVINRLMDANGYLQAIAVGVGILAAAGPLGTVFRGLRTAGGLALRAGRSALSGIRAAPGAIRAGAGAVGSAVSTTAGVVKNAAGTVIGGVSTAGNAVRSGVTTAGNAVRSAAPTAVRTVTSAADDAAAIASRISARVAETTASSLGKSFVKKIPLIGLGAGLGLGAWRAMQGDFVGAGGEVASGVVGTLPGAGTAASIAIDAALLARDIAKIYEDEGYSSEDAERLSNVDASEQLLNDMTDRITRAEAGENVYWGRDSVGIAEDQSNMQDLLVSEIARLTDIMEQTGELSQREADALARYNDMLSNMDQPTGMEILDQVGVDSGIISQMNETDQDAVTLMANKVDTLAEKLADGNLTETDRGKVMKEYASAINDLKTIEENGITAEAKQQAQRAKDRDVNVQALLKEKAMIEGMSGSEEGIPDESKARINEIDKIISGLDEVARGDLSLPGDAILKMRESTANKLRADKDKLAALEEEYGKATQIGVNEKQAKALLRSGIADNEEQANEMAAIYGYEDEEANKKYQERSKAVREGEDQLKRIENDMRYKKARANELAREMGISTEKITQSEDGKTTKYTNQDGYEIKDGGLYVNGQRVPDELLNQTERDRFKAQETQYNAFNRVPTSKAPDANEPTDDSKNNQNNDNKPQTAPEKTRDLLEENNRLLRKTIETIEQGQ